MIKALLIGGSNYPPGQNSLWRVRGDLEKMQAVLEQTIARSGTPGSATEARVSSLCDRPRQETKAAIKAFFASLSESDSAIFVFSGYGFQESNGTLHFVVCPDADEVPETMRDDPDNFISARSVQQAMNDSKAKHQVVILDCNFRHTFAESAEIPEASVALGDQLGGDRRVILTSSIAVQPIGEPEAIAGESNGDGVWSYLRYLAEGIETGAADQNIDGKVSAAELHHYAKQKLTTAAPANEAQLLDLSADAANAPILTVPEPESASYYRQVLEQHRTEANEVDEAGEKFLSGRSALKNIREAFELAPEKADAIEREVLRPVREFRRRQQVYHQRFAELTQMQQTPASDRTRQQLEQLQRSLHLTEGDVAAIAALPQSQHQQKQRERSQENLSRYEQAYLAALQRQNPLNDHDRQILNSLKQVLHLKDEDIAALGQRLSPLPEPVDTAPPPSAPSVFIDRPKPFPPPPEPAPAPVNHPAPTTEVQATTQLQTPPEAAVASKAPVDAAVTEAPLSPITIVDGESELAARRRRQRDLLLAILGAALVFGLASYLYFKNLFPFNLFNKPIDQAAAQKFNELGQTSAQDGYNAKAIENYTKAIELNPNDTSAYVNRGLSHHRMGKLDDAIQDYNTAIALDPKLARAYSNRSHVYYDKKDIPRALEDANRAAVSDSKLAEAWINLANAQFAGGNMAGAIDNYTRAINLKPGKTLLAGAHTNRGNVIAQNDVNAAFKDYNRAIEINPEFAEAFYNRGLGFEKMGNQKSAINDYEKAAGLYLQQGYIAQQELTLKRIKTLRETTPPPPTLAPNQLPQAR